MPDTDEKLSRPATSKPRELTEAVVSEIRESLRGLRYGIVQIIVQDGLVVQIDRTERRRLRRNGES